MTPIAQAGGTPYLEVHHRVPLAENGEDTVKNAVAICPNCHRKAHDGQAPFVIYDSRSLSQGRLASFLIG